MLYVNCPCWLVFVPGFDLSPNCDISVSEERVMNRPVSDLKVLALTFALFGLLLIPNFAFGDNVYASIRGLITDPQGAAVSNITVTATNTDTGIVTKATSSVDGNYVFPQLAIGTYRVLAVGAGFKSFQTSSFVLTVNQTYNLPIKFELGSTSDTVEVRADTAQVETTSIQLQTLVDEKKIVDLPLINRNWTALEQLTPGVVAASDRFGTYSANGSQSSQSSYLINGVDSNDLPLNTAVIIPSVDALQEFNIITNTINPEYGRNSGAIVNAVIKNGTNQFHGDAFEFYRDTFLNTSNWLTQKPPQYHQNDFGATIGGPIWKDHTFAFFSFQGIKYRAPQSGAPSESTVFSAAELGGDFSSSPSFYDPVTNPEPVGSPCGPGYTGPFGASPLPFAVGSAAAGTPWCVAFPTGNLGGNTAFNSLAAGLAAKYIPAANSGTSQFTFNPTETGTGNYQEIVRIDHTFNSSDSIWGTMFLQSNPTSDPIPLPGGSTLPGFGIIAQRHYKQFIVDWTHSFNSSTLNEFRLGYTRFNFVADQPTTPIAPSSAGFNINPQIASGESLPYMNIEGSYGFAIGFTTNGPQPRKDQTRELTDNFSKVIGNHAIKAGFDLRRFDVWNPFAGSNNGSYAYNGAGAFTSGDAGADFLLGIPDTFTQGSGGLIIGRAYEYYSYLQDQWKVKPNLTLTLGTGWQVDTPLANQQFGGKDVTCFRPGQQSSVFPNAPQDMLYPGDKGCDNTGGLKVPYTHFGPRIGFAWSPDAGRLSGGSGRLSVRGGWGFYYNRAEEEGILQNLGTPPFSITSHGVQDVSGTFSPAFANPYTDIQGRSTEANPFPFVPPAGSAAAGTLWSQFEPLSLNAFSPKYTTPEAMNYNLTIQRELGGNAVFNIGYVGAVGHHLIRAIEGNPITLAGAAACLTNIGTEAGCPANAFIQHQLYPQNALLGVAGAAFGSVGTQTTDGNSTYNALQVGINKTFSHGLGMLANFTWSHAIDDGSGFEDSGFQVRAVNPYPQFNYLNKGNSSYDARRRFVAGYTYQAPGLHGHPLLNTVVGGWQLSGITTFQSGFPVDVSDSNFTSLTCDAFVYYDCWESPQQIGPLQTHDPRNFSQGKNNHFFYDGAAVFAPAAVGTFGGVRRNSFAGPGINNWDMALEKQIYFHPSHESQYLQLRLEAYNVFNHTQFCNPAGPFPCVNGNVESSRSGQATSVAPSRLVQLGAKFYF
jgi:Carboxypeptidase regulatory-like domain